ncbi:MAG: LLM class flavin-dependent oxidoreductase [Actinomycetota bacterium]
MKFGIQLPQEGVSFQAVLDHARYAESLGYEHFWIPDHLIPVAAGGDSPECWTTLTAALCGTSMIRGGPLVLCDSFRNPALLANMAATLQRICDGRLILGVGAGWYEAEFDAYGFEFRSGAERVRKLDRSLAIIKEWCLQHDVRIPIWVGGKGPEILRVASKHADAWNAPILSPEEIRERAAGLTIPVTYEGPVWIDEDETRINRRLERNASSENPTLRTYARTAIAGTPKQVIERIREYEQAGVSELVCHFGRTDDHRSTELFAKEVFPAFS